MGIALGAIGAWGASRWLKSLVFGVSADSPAMMMLAGAAVIAFAAVAASLPVWRAVRTDPVRNLHEA
jgi:ABC-type lipoprotein release transport system permease subunit